MKPSRTILITFAGRRDRMALLNLYARAALARGLIDEWHIWQFARNETDLRWLREQFPVAQTTPNHSTAYFALPEPLSVPPEGARFSFSVRALHDAHIALKRRSGSGDSFEIVLGGWNNQFSALRKFSDARAVEDHSLRDPATPANFAAATPGLLPEFGFSDVTLDVGSAGLKVAVAGTIVLHDPDPVAVGDFEVLYRTGYGANGDWRFPSFVNHPARLFVTGPEPHFPASAIFYNQAYQYYIANADVYRDDVLLKCDDDIVYFDLERLADFVAFRQSNPQYFLVSANVVNNGVCAHFQQAMGAIPKEAMVCEMPPGGMCGTLWNSGAKAEILHRLFLANPGSFRPEAAAPIVWNERVSINFIALLGRDLVHIPDVSSDDEHDLCYGVRKRAKKQNCIFPSFVAAHLSFYKQDAEMNVASVLRGYHQFAQDCCPKVDPELTGVVVPPPDATKDVAA